MTRFSSNLLIVCCLFFGFSNVSSAQPILQNLGSNPIIAGVPLQCGGKISYVANINDIAMAQSGAMYFRPDYFYLPATLQHFIYAHECAHAAFGLNEQAADCWAMKLGRNQGFFNQQSVQAICSYTFNSPGDWTHLPGPQRCQQMQICFVTP
jgi:hypothetical protein